jgi:hypothetical protein
MEEAAPIACSLDSAAYRDRLASMRAIGAEGLIGNEEDGSRWTLHFADSDAMRARLASVVEAESHCCSFLDLSLETKEGRISLSIEAPDSARPVVREIVEAIASGAETVR